MQNKLLLCGCGWLGGYAAEHFKSDFAITGTTRSESKAQQLASQGIKPLLFGLGYWIVGYGFAFLIISLPAVIIGISLSVLRNS